jgi:hypothetical protein
VLFGGIDNGVYLDDTWTWQGSDWTQRPASSIALNVYSGPPGTVVTVLGWALSPASACGFGSPTR